MGNNIEEYEKEQRKMIEKEGTCKSTKIFGDTIYHCSRQFYHYGRHVSEDGAKIW